MGKRTPLPCLSPQESEGFILERVNAAIRRNASLLQAAAEGPLLVRMPHLALLRRAFPSIRATDTTGTAVVPAPFPAETRPAPLDAVPA